MATLLYRLGKTAHRRWPVVLVMWLVILTGLGTFAAVFSKPLNRSFSIPGVASMQAADLQQDLFPDDRIDEPAVGHELATTGTR